MSHVPDGELTAFADGAYAPADADAQRIAAHLALCPDCRNRLEQAHALSTRAAEILAVAAPTAVAMPTFDEVRARAAKRRTRSTFPLAWAATVILALGIGWFGRGALKNPQLDRALMRPEPQVELQSEAVAPPVAAPTAAAPQPTDGRQSTRALEERARTQPSPKVATGQAARDEAAEVRALVPQAAAAPPSVAKAEADLSGEAARAPSALARSAIEYLTAADAERRGIELHAVPELEILRVGLREGSVQVEQKLPDGKIVTVVAVAQSPADDAATRAIAPAGVPAQRRAEAVREGAASEHSVVVSRGMVRLRISAALPEDSLRALAATIR